jgi:hypothetical protein
VTHERAPITTWSQRANAIMPYSMQIANTNRQTHQGNAINRHQVPRPCATPSFSFLRMPRSGSGGGVGRAAIIASAISLASGFRGLPRMTKLHALQVPHDRARAGLPAAAARWPRAHFSALFKWPLSIPISVPTSVPTSYPIQCPSKCPLHPNIASSSALALVVPMGKGGTSPPFASARASSASSGGYHRCVCDREL